MKADFFTRNDRLIKALLWFLAAAILIVPGLVQSAFADAPDFVTLGTAPFDTPIVTTNKLAAIESAAETAVAAHMAGIMETNTCETAPFSLVVGRESQTGATGTLAVGLNADASKARSAAIGYNTEASGYQTFALGYGASATNDDSFVWQGVHAFYRDDKGRAIPYRYYSHGHQTFNINPGGDQTNKIDRIYIGEKTLRQIIDERIEEHGGGADLEAISQALDEIVGTQSEE